MIFKQPVRELSALRSAIVQAHHADEQTLVEQLILLADGGTAFTEQVRRTAQGIVQLVKQHQHEQDSMETILKQYDLSTNEGIALLCIAEALLRIPDNRTVDQLMQDKLTGIDWSSAVQQESWFANAIGLALVLTGKVYSSAQVNEQNLANALKKWMQRGALVALRPAIKSFMKLLGRKFVMGQTIDAALDRAAREPIHAYRYSYDMLGEAACTAADAQRYFAAYVDAIKAIGVRTSGTNPIERAGISIKLSALHPRYDYAQHQRVMDELVPRVIELCLLAQQYDINLTIDAEEADRLELSLDVIESICAYPALRSWQGFGVAVQSYQKRALAVLDWLAHVARQHERKIMVRLIKGAYWDYEIKHAQELNRDSYPVFTRKSATDVSFIACVKRLIGYTDALFPQFATHNAYSIAVVLTLIGDNPFEFQCLHGMGQAVYDHLVNKEGGIHCRIYAPVGGYRDLLGYLMRRLLENGANTSFVHLLAQQEVSEERLLLNPVADLRSRAVKPHPRIPLPMNLFHPSRQNSRAIDLTDLPSLLSLQAAMNHAASQQWTAQPVIKGQMTAGTGEPVFSPIDGTPLGTVITATAVDIESALTCAAMAANMWRLTNVTTRADYLRRAADLLEERMPLFMTLAVLEAGKTLVDALAEVREAVDFCRYYAALAEEQCRVQYMQGVTGELNEFVLQGRGAMLSISPWNFPLAIFMGQVSAALVTGNTVIAKPAEQTPLIAMQAIKLLHDAGVPHEVLHYLPGSGEKVGARLVADLRISGVLFTGSTETAAVINQILAQRGGALVPFIAETGGQNAMIVDSTALPEQVVADVLRSAFGSAGQRCSALRVLYLQEDIADKVLTMLAGAIAELTVGDPRYLSTDVGPVIDAQALATLQAHDDYLSTHARFIARAALPTGADRGHFFAPCIFEIDHLLELQREVFGPILHVIRFKLAQFDRVIEEINATGYGLTLGIHTRLESRARALSRRVNVGNVYVNRHMTGAVVGVQPFGGMNLSGTGPKAGGPNYLLRLCHERSLCINTTAAGGNASLLTLSDDGE